jgi:hypothetical protein
VPDEGWSGGPQSGASPHLHDGGAGLAYGGKRDFVMEWCLMGIGEGDEGWEVVGDAMRGGGQSGASPQPHEGGCGWDVSSGRGGRSRAGVPTVVGMLLCVT